MTYLALARKYRPKNFSELIGQNILVSILSNAIRDNRLYHAFLFTGSRGVGKTTTARVLAKSINCIGKSGNEGPTIHPCEECINCSSISNFSHPDVIEFDAASNTGIDDIKEIISNTKYVPILARKKIFIIDEVHMLSAKAFNALLKTLEEPPSNILFIFATTEIRKVPITILSRCQKFFLRLVDEKLLETHLRNIALEEGFQIENTAVALLAAKAAGSVRDALSLLDQAILSSTLNPNHEKIISFESVEKMLQTPNKDSIGELYKTILNGNIQECLKIYNELHNSGLLELEIISDIMEEISNEIKEKALENKENLNSMPALLRLYQVLIKGLDDIKHSENKKLCTEILLIKLCYLSFLPTPIEVIERLKNNELNSVLNAFDGAKLI